ncbi:MAG: EAL domain-containing protein [Rhizobiaceae bacterium]|nr:EAL domain-containing protein [Rhizobiaceae bacterium]
MVYIMFSALDVFVVPDVAAYTIAARFAVAILSLAMMEWQFRTNAGADVLDLVCASGIVLGFLGWIVPASFTIEQSVGEYYRIYGAVFMIGANLFFAFRAAVALTTCLSILLTLSATILLSGQGGTVQSLIFGSFYFSCFFFTSYVAMKLENERYRAFLNSYKANLHQEETQAHGQALLKLSYTDALTNVHNRRSVDVKLHEFWSRWQTERRSFAAILVDVDFFKNFNDRHGHQQGDRCLVEVANSLASVAKCADGLVGRYGGEEFIILAPVQTSAAAESLAETVRRTVEQLGIEHGLRRDGHSVVTVSVGVSYTRSDSTTNLERIVHEADRALYAAKSDGRNCVKLFDPKDPNNDDMNETVAALLKIAVERGLVSLVYQPIHGVESGRLEAVETLMRLRSVDGTSVPPSMFIPVAERMGAIVTLGTWAICTVCRDALATGLVPVASVNVSAVQLRNPGFAAAVASILMETGVMGSRLALEITEGLEIDMDLVVLNCIADLKRLGVRIWLDDFGTGFAGLSWLRMIEFDTVKIDKSFLHGINEPKGRLMLLDIITLVRNCGPRILVEGIETADQLKFAQSAGLHQVQGYYVGRPSALSEIVFLQNGKKSSTS